MPPTWLPVFPAAVTRHQKHTDQYVSGCFVPREMPTVLYLRVAWRCSVQCSDRDLGQHRIVGLPVCIATELQHSAAAALQGCWATGLCLQGLLAARLQRSRARACGANNTPAHAKEREVNANVNSIILKSLPKFGKLFKIIEFTFAFTSHYFACAGASE